MHYFIDLKGSEWISSKLKRVISSLDISTVMLQFAELLVSKHINKQSKNTNKLFCLGPCQMCLKVFFQSTHK